jgi:hypothetical protein
LVYIPSQKLDFYLAWNIHFEPGEDTFDRQVYKEYTQMGTKVKFLVWPALFLHEGGALIWNNVKTTNEFVLIYNILN